MRKQKGPSDRRFFPTVNFNNTTATIPGLIPGIQIKIVNPFKLDTETGEETEYSFDKNGCLGRITAPNYYIDGKQGSEIFNQLINKKRTNVRQNKSAVTRIEDYDGVGLKTLAVLNEAGLVTAQLIVKAGEAGLKAAGVHSSVLKNLLSQAKTAVQKSRTAQSESEDVEFLKQVARNTYFALEMQIIVTDAEALKNTVFYTVDGKRNITRAKMRTENEFGGATVPHFRKRIRIKAANSEVNRGLFHTEQVEDCLRYAVLMPDGKIKNGEIALVSQEGEFFLSIQESSTLQAYWNNPGVVIPELEERRKQYCDFFRNTLFKKWMRLPNISSYRPRREFDLSLLRKGQAHVDFFSVAQRTGAASFLNDAGERVTVKLHYSQIQTGTGIIQRLDEGDIISYESIQEHTAPSGKKTGFALEAAGVRYLFNKFRILNTLKKEHSAPEKTSNPTNNKQLQKNKKPGTSGKQPATR